ncbi:hypothetical protein JOB18_012607 [Solea senegalensis]|uniref:Uncharacterized protein n=1 Tax=Solea senegalensis TaxID=28829 RepID=A0AAV6QGN4_SOLSE|nr:uncharacterized protein LOC122769678 [Solea senegalensis]KAG7489456.1 hypothetical protein JOB18_012607 [Solea senegalensis]
MNNGAGSLKVVCVWMAVLLQSLDAQNHVPKTQKTLAAGLSCQLRQLTILIKGQLEESLEMFDEANGKHLGKWLPGFPELQVDHDTPLLPSNVQCSLLFMEQGLKEVLEDQWSNLNPTDDSLLKTLQDTIVYIHMLNKCVKHMLGGDCSSKPLPPKIPTYVFERKQWSHTLLKTSKGYMNWLEHRLSAYILKVTVKNNLKWKLNDVLLQKYVKKCEHLV